MSRNETEKYFSAITVKSIHAVTKPIAHLSRDVLPFMQKMEIVNSTSKPVWIGTRLGITYAVSPTVHADVNREPGVLIRLTTSLDRFNVKIDASAKLNDPRTDDLRNVSKSINDGNLNTGNRNIHGLDFFVSAKDLERSDGLVYLANCDLQVSTRIGGCTPEHPFSQPGIDYHIVTDNDILNCKRSMAISLKIVDNSDRISSRYVNLGGVVFQIKPESNIMVRPGLYVVLNGHSADGYRTAEPVQDFYPLDEMDEKFGGLYMTYEEALHNGDLRKQRESEITELERKHKLKELELKTLETELRVDKHKYQVLLQELELKLNQAKQEAEFRKLDYTKENDRTAYREKQYEFERKREQMYAEDVLEERSMRRKEMAEFAKVALQITAQVILGIALPLIIKSNK